MLSGVRLTATLSGAQPVEEQMCPLHSANHFFSSAVLLVGACYLLQTFLPFQNIPFASSCRQTPTSWAPARSKMGSTYLGDQAWSAAQGEGCFLAARQQGLQTGAPEVLPATRCGCWRLLGLRKLCRRPSLCPRLPVQVHTCPRAALSDDA